MYHFSWNKFKHLHCIQFVYRRMLGRLSRLFSFTPLLSGSLPVSRKSFTEFSEYRFLIKVSRTAKLNLANSLDICLFFLLFKYNKYILKVTQNAKYGISAESPDFQIFPGEHAPWPPLGALAFSTCFVASRSPFSQVAPCYCCSWLPKLNLQNSSFRVQPYFLRARDSETLICDTEISRLV